MNDVQQGIITLIRSALTGQALSVPEGFDLETAYPQILRHGILTLTYDGAVLCGIDRKLPVMRRLFQGYVKALMHSEQQLQVLEQVCAAFDRIGVDYMPLKGATLKALYPRPEHRLMGDADVLIRTEQYDQIRPILLELGLEEQVESDHELIWRCPSLHLELHKRLIPSYNKDYYRYFGDGWQLANIRNGCRWGMTHEDAYIYLFTHFAKHYRDGGIGCRHLVDLWVYRQAHPLDEAYIAAQLKALQLFTFEQNIRAVLAVWFEHAEETEKTAFITDVIFQSGAWGSREAHAASLGTKNAAISGSIQKGRMMRAVQVIFPGAAAMRHRYPILEKHPGLLPLLWPVRWGSVLLLRREKLRQQYEELQMTNAAAVQTYQQALQYVGLDFHFKED